MPTMTRTDLQNALDALYAFAPDRIGPLSLICTCDQCLPPEALQCLETRPLRALPPEAVSHWFASAPAFHDDGYPIGPFDHARAAEHWPEAFAMLVKVIEALADEVTADGSGLSVLRRDWWFVEPAAWSRRLLACDLPARLPPAARRVLDWALMALVDEALATGSPRLLDTLEYLGAFGRRLPAVLAWVEAQPLKAQLAFWAQVLGGRASAPDGQKSRGWVDFRHATQIMPRALAGRMNRAFMNPRLGAFLLRACRGLKDPLSRDMAACAYVLWENSAFAMERPVVAARR